MNNISLHQLGLALALAGTLAACNNNSAPEPAATESAPAATTESVPVATAPAMTPAPGSEPTAATTPIPDSADGIWLAIDQHNAELKTTIANGDLKQVHHHAFAIRDLVAALPAHSPTLPAADQATLQNEIKFVTTLADRLDETGDAEDRAGAQSNYDQMATLLNGITRNK